MALKLKLKKGKLHHKLGIAEDKKIPEKDLEIHKGDSVTTIREKTFAKNASHWKH